MTVTKRPSKKLTAELEKTAKAWRARMAELDGVAPDPGSDDARQGRVLFATTGGSLVVVET